ncbi:MULTISPECIES: hypothetical protein [Massilia]|jgi:hypothetical protein|uniref:Uncharacterized protein n=1 Tax=Massilia orientalis TaxID=3050128 RepID=A0ACC7MA42_9BURK|nr:hypothetical protein [Massilia sp. YIM B02787]
MRPLPLALSASLLLFAPGAGAQSGNYPINDDTPISRVEVTAQPRPAFRIWDYQAEDVSGAYALSNGWRLKVKPARDGIVAQIDKQRPMRLIAQSPDRFVSRDGNVIMEFNKGDTRDDMMMSYVPSDVTDPRLAQIIVVTAKMAQR